MKPFYAHGKLMITSEYMVMYGADALSLPLKVGQTLHLKPSANHAVFSWKASYLDRFWFEVEFNPSNLNIIRTTDKEIALRLAGYLKTIISISSTFQRELFTWDVETHLEFNPDWGFGSSSSLTALLAEWAELNPLDLHMQISSGSGYDVASAIAEGPIIYRIKHDSPQYRHVHFNPAFSENIFFAWLGNKQSSHESVLKFKDFIKPGLDEITFFNSITGGMLHAENWTEFGELMKKHETRLSEILKTPTIGSTLFNDLDGYVKSLGAWGGDFVMIVTGQDPDDLKRYLKNKKINILFPFNEIVKHGHVV